MAKIEAGLAEIDEGQGIPHNKVKQRRGAANRPDLYRPLAAVMPAGTEPKLLDAERGDR